MKNLVYVIIIVIIFFQNSGFAQNRAIKPSKNARKALVIGNGNYQYITKLKNPVNDANLIENQLKNLGFNVTKILNSNSKEMVKEIASFTKNLNSGEIGLFYYAGHGIQIKGENYLLPVDLSPMNPEFVEFDSVNLRRLTDSLQYAKNESNIIILDSCRNNPFQFERSLSRGLAELRAPKGVYISFATQPGNIAEDGSGLNSPYTSSLARALSIPNLKIEDVFKKVRADVSDKTGDRQVPWDSSSLVGDIYLNQSTRLLLTEIEEVKTENVGLDFSSINKTLESDEKNWSEINRKMVEDYQKVIEIDESSPSNSIKLRIWQEFYNEYGQNNPYTSNDDNMKETALEKIKKYTNSVEIDKKSKKEDESNSRNTFRQCGFLQNMKNDKESSLYSTSTITSYPMTTTDSVMASSEINCDESYVFYSQYKFIVTNSIEIQDDLSKSKGEYLVAFSKIFECQYESIINHRQYLISSLDNLKNDNSDLDFAYFDYKFKRYLNDKVVCK